MDNLSAEVGHKMRSAVKAKLIEMGTGGSAGYIDDELPDYVMIMVANKRSKQQMTDDLTLFLSDHTPKFVDWLYLVLQKLQEVAIPAVTSAAALSAASAVSGGKSSKPASTGKHHQSSGTGNNTKDNAKDRDAKRGSADKKATVSSSKRQRRTADDDTDRSNTPPLLAGPQPSITDVFAEHLIQKARTTMDAQDAGRTLKTEADDGASAVAEPVKSRRREIAALAELQKKINQAKRQLAGDGHADSDDEDFINLNDEDVGAEAPAVHADENGGSHISPAAAATERSAARVPITFRADSVAASAEKSSAAAAAAAAATVRPTAGSRSSVLDRLGVRHHGDGAKSTAVPSSTSSSSLVSVASRVHDTNATNSSSSASRHRAEQEIYVPSFRRKDAPGERNSERDRNPERSSGSGRDRDRDRSDQRSEKRGDHHHSDRDSVARRDRDRERERERDLLRSRNPDRDGSGTFRNDRNPERSRERTGGAQSMAVAAPTGTARLRDRLGAAVNTNHNHGGSSSASVASASADLRDRMRDRSQQNVSSSSVVPSTKPRSSLESKVHVAATAGTADVPLSSAVKVQMRPVLPPNRQACKSLLLRAMAEAQKSTALVKPREDVQIKRQAVKGTEVVIDLDAAMGATKLFTKSFRNKANIVIEVARDEVADGGLVQSEDTEDTNSEVEYIMENIEYEEIADDSEEGEEEEQQQQHDVEHDEEDEQEAEHSDDMIHDEEEDDMEMDGFADVNEDDESSPRGQQRSTQFVVTLDDLKTNKYAIRTAATAAKRPGLLRTPRPLSNGEDGDAGDDVAVAAGVATQKVNKLIIKNDTDDEEELRKEVERSNVRPKSVGLLPTVIVEVQNSDALKQDQGGVVVKTEVPSAERADEGKERRKRRRLSPITFDTYATTMAGDVVGGSPEAMKRKRSGDRGDRSTSSPRRGVDDKFDAISSEAAKARAEKYDSVPASLISDQLLMQHLHGGKERCRFYPACSKGDSCEFSHPFSTQCKQFPNCKFGDQCMYYHPRCKYDLTCTNVSCNFSHSLVATSTAPPLSSHVVPVSNYKSITNTPMPALCRFHPKCSNALCTFYHPKPCRFGRNCGNRAECVFWHSEEHASGRSSSSGGAGGSSGTSNGGKDKLKWFASSTVY